jgi:Bacterial Ig domain
VTAADVNGSVSHVVSVTRTTAAQPGPLAITINVPPATTASATITLSGTVSGGSGSPTVHWITSTGASDGSTLSAGTWTILSIPLAMGLNTITVTAADATGSVSQIVSVTRTVATLPGPLVLMINPPPATTTALTMSLSGTVTGGSGSPAVTWSNSMGSFDGTAISGSNWVISNVPLTIGLNNITVTAADATGSVSQIVSVTRTATAPGGTDTAGPALTITYPSSTSVATMLASFTFSGTASDPSGVASVTWSTDTGGAGTASGTTPSLNTQWSAVIPLLVGFNQVIIRATDTAGNISWRSVIVTRH